MLLPLDAGQPEQTYYSAFGEETGSRLSPWRFSSKRVDSTGLVYYGRRFYQPELGRWLSPDPAGFTNGMNLYAFVVNCPLTHFDEYGLEFTSFTNDWLRPQPWNNWGLTSWHQRPWHDMSERFGSKPRFIVGPSYSALPKPWRALSANPDYAPIYYRNGILNSVREGIEGTLTLRNTYRGLGNLVPAYGVSYGAVGDLASVFSSLVNPSHMTDSISQFRRNLEWDIFCMDVMNDPRKIFLHGFSRRAADIFHATKNFTRQQRDRLIITACGPIMILPRSLGFKVTNLISKGDWYSLACNSYMTPESITPYANVRFLPQKDSNGAMGDHFFQSKTYQEAIKEHSIEDYKEYGVRK
jgi:RHS repeat-associated protein